MSGFAPTSNVGDDLPQPTEVQRSVAPEVVDIGLDVPDGGTVDEDNRRTFSSGTRTASDALTGH
ncbi:hypothetical protein [uncultured Friedmanniella sp.]|uniref:hypothetical protein n=1 Tax=uncultured Friedmanniella sp. TaxID=335381 RepID=UPI0035CC3073